MAVNWERWFDSVSTNIVGVYLKNVYRSLFKSYREVLKSNVRHMFVMFFSRHINQPTDVKYFLLNL